MIAKIVLNTEAEPFIASAQGTRDFFTFLIANGSGIPMKNDIGIITINVNITLRSTLNTIM